MGQLQTLISLFKRSPVKAGKRVIGALQRRGLQQYSIYKDRRYTTYQTSDVSLQSLYRNLTEIDLPDTPLAQHFLNHEFDLLGSGWTHIHYGMNCAGVENHHYASPMSANPDPQGAWLDAHINRANLSHSQAIWQQVFLSSYAHPTYQPIDWQLDFKSGYRWDSRTHITAIPYGHKPGVDIKVPWELSRLQHLPYLALRATNQDHIKNETRGQILDFIALNPPRFGVNWRCPMDIAIRVVNLVMTHNILGKLDDMFESILANAIQAHIDHILTHLEWSEEARGNHYFANVLGLLFGASALPQTARNKAILAFSIQEFFIEADRQFLEDGTSFEGSTGYHRLSSEMLYWGTALIMGLDDAVTSYDPKAIKVRPPFKGKALHVENNQIVISTRIVEICQKSAEFIAATTLPNGLSLKLGDYDSGRLLKLDPPENITNHQSAIEFSKALYTNRETVEGQIIATLRKDRLLKPAQSVQATLYSIQPSKSEPHDQINYTIPLDDLDLSSIETFSYQDMGLYIWKGDNFFLSLRCHSGEGLREWGHFHDDNLALSFSHKDAFIADPGTYLYTALPEERMSYQSAKAHFVPRLEDCPAMIFGPSLFEAHPLAKGQCLNFKPSAFDAILKGTGWQIRRCVTITSKAIEITDISLTQGKKLQRNIINHSLKDTLGYGKKSTRSVSSI